MRKDSRYVSRRLLMPSSCTSPPEPLWRGTRPRYAAHWRPERNVLASPIVATAAVAVSSPTPGIAAIRSHCSCRLLHEAIWRSTSVICAVRLRTSSSWRRSWGCSRAGTADSAGSSAAAAWGSIVRQPRGSSIPNSPIRPCSWLIAAVRALFKRSRIACSASTACCSSVLTATVRISGCWAAVQIAWASATSFLFVLHGRIPECKGVEVKYSLQVFPRPAFCCTSSPNNPRSLLLSISVMATANVGCCLTSGLRLQLILAAGLGGIREKTPHLHEGLPLRARTNNQACVFRGPTAAPPLNMNDATSLQQIACLTDSCNAGHCERLVFVLVSVLRALCGIAASI